MRKTDGASNLSRADASLRQYRFLSSFFPNQPNNRRVVVVVFPSVVIASNRYGLLACNSRPGQGRAGPTYLPQNPEIAIWAIEKLVLSPIGERRKDWMDEGREGGREGGHRMKGTGLECKQRPTNETESPSKSQNE